MRATPPASSGQRAWLIVSILYKKGLDMLGHFFNMWCGKEVPCSDSANLHRLTPSSTKLWPDMSGIRYRPSDRPLGRHDIENSSRIFPNVVASYGMECGPSYSTDLKIGEQLFVAGNSS